jgi:hypothetical protein
MSILIIPLILLLVSCNSSGSRNDCEVRGIWGVDKLSSEKLKLAEAIGDDWMKNALVCQMGEFEIATPTNGRKNVILILKKGKPVFYRNCTETRVYSPKLKDAAYEKVMVDIWHGGDDNDVKRIWYQTIGKYPEVNLYDTNFDGQPTTKTIWGKNEIIELYKWENGYIYR